MCRRFCPAMYSLDLLLEAALLCLPGSGLVSRNTEWVRVSSDIKLCSLRCDEAGIYTLDRDSSLPILDFACSDNSTNIYSNYQQRLSLNVSAGCCTIANAQPSDSGTYELSFYGERKKKVLVGVTNYHVIEAELLRLRIGAIFSLLFISLFIGGVCLMEKKKGHSMKIPTCIKNCPPWSMHHVTSHGKHGAVT
uniref:Uncharacterized protein n=1 Tax=Xenopus tropicalis TaxID=8364 RepID=A0A1B8Y5Y5_XENTR